MARIIGRKCLISVIMSQTYKPEHLLVRYAVTGHPNADKVISAVTAGRAERWLQSYEDFVGLTEVKEAQNNVIEVSSSNIIVK